ncbi:MAG: ATP synthase F1 subunit epsilon [Alphaproteobacteria bacterium]|nr:ATP synthase F1 subunit epsilon [Alphaproteobacteria bacterium]MBF0249732.1 ATP synthase F1 subunit epsilon [Alphaproteobacteria bacterium]
METTAELVQFELVAPQRLVKSQAVEMVVVPCTEGDIGVLPGHAPLIATVRPGVIEMYENGMRTQSIFVAGGFVEVNPQRCTVLVEEAIATGAIDREKVEARIAAAKQALEDAQSEAEKAQHESGIEMLEAMLDAMESVVHTHQ